MGLDQCSCVHEQDGIGSTQHTPQDPVITVQHTPQGPAHLTGPCDNSHQTLRQPKPQHMYQEFDWCMWPAATDYRVTEQTVSVTSSSTCHKVL